MESIALYARASISEEDLKVQVDNLTKYPDYSKYQVLEFFESVSGIVNPNTRPKFNQMIELIRKKQINIVVVNSLDRLSRSVEDMITTIKDFEKYGVKLVSLREKIDVDTTTAMGKFMLTMIGAFAELDRKWIIEKLQMGRKLSMKTGKTKTGNPCHRKKIILDINQIRKLRENQSLSQIAKLLNVSPVTIYNRLNGK